MKEKLGIDYKKYLILGACNPQFAHQALEIEEDIGLLLPCNVVVYDKEGKSIIAAINPSLSIKQAGNKKLASLAKEVERS